MHVRSLFESLEKSVEVLDFAEQTLHLWRHILRLNKSFLAFISQCGNLNFFLQFRVKVRLWVSSMFSNSNLENYMNCQNGKMAILKTDNLPKVISRKIWIKVKVIEFYTYLSLCLHPNGCGSDVLLWECENFDILPTSCKLKVFRIFQHSRHTSRLVEFCSSHCTVCKIRNFTHINLYKHLVKATFSVTTVNWFHEKFQSESFLVFPHCVHKSCLHCVFSSVM